MILIDSDAALVARCQRWAQAPALALDTEFVRTDTYYAQLCLVQVDDGSDPAVVDALAVHDLEPLLERLRDPQQVKILHSGSQDLEILAPMCDAPVAPLFDTQRAAEMLGEGEQLSYAALVERHLGVKLDKSLTRTDWRHRPLRRDEMAYAAADVSYLRRLYPLLRDALAARGRLAWLREDCAQLAAPARYQEDPRDAWRRLKHLPRLPPEAQAAAVALAQWRELTARGANRPRRWILSDDALYALATRRPHDAAALAAVREVPASLARHHGGAILRCIATAHDELPNGAGAAPPLDDEQRKGLDALRGRLAALAERLEVPRGLLANRSDLERLVRQGDASDIPLLHGWRRRVAAEVLELDGAAPVTASGAG
ncbi:MAG TPA: ribonuclease D [Nevskiaceae bacterium]